MRLCKHFGDPMPGPKTETKTKNTSNLIKLMRRITTRLVIVFSTMNGTVQLVRVAIYRLV